MQKEEKIQDVRVIAVKNKAEVLKAAELFEKVGIRIFGSKESKQRFIKNGDDVKNNFLIRDNDGNCRIQSHFLTDGTSVSELEKRVNKIVKENKTNEKRRSKFLNEREWNDLRRKYIDAENELVRRELREKYPMVCKDNEIGLTTVFETNRFLFGNQMVISNNGKQLCRLTLFYGKEDALGIGINDDGSGIRFKLVNGKDKHRAEQYLVPIYPKNKKVVKSKNTK